MVDVGDDGDVAELHERALLAPDVRTGAKRAGAVLLNAEMTGMRRRAVGNRALPSACAAQYTKGRRKGRAIGAHVRSRRNPELAASSSTFMPIAIRRPERAFVRAEPRPPPRYATA